MDSDEHNKVIAFDTLFCTNHIQMLKVMLPYMDHQMQKSMAIYIKFLELNYTINYFKRHPLSLCSCMQEEPPDIFKICSELIPYCTENEKRQLEQIKNIRQGMEMYKEMSQAMDMIKEFMPDASSFMDNFSNGHADGKNFFDGTSSDGNASSGGENSGTAQGGTGGFDLMNMLMNMLTPEQKQMYEMFGGNQNAE